MKNTKIIGKITIGILACVIGLQAQANEKGNGGGAFVCRDSKGKIISAELVDFYEGASEYKLSVKKTAAEVEDQVNRASVKFVSAMPSRAQVFLESVQNIQTLMNVVPNAKLENTNDFNLRVAPKTCVGGTVKFEQLANYTDDNRLTVDEEIYDSLSNADKAGLVIHEAAYLLSRQWHDSVSSREARRLTAFLFSSTPTQSISRDVLEMNLIDPNSNKKWVCSALIVGAEFEEVKASSNSSFENCKYSSCYVKENVEKRNISAYGSDLFKAQSNLSDLVEITKPFPSKHPSYVYAESYCGADSNATILDAIKTWEWRSTNLHTIIDCQRTWSPNFDCKQI